MTRRPATAAGAAGRGRDRPGAGPGAGPRAADSDTHTHGGVRRERVAHRPRKRFGQHFLERTWVDKLVKDIAPDPAESFLEIGPGAGALTLPLAASGARIRAIDIDRDLAAGLAARVPTNVTVVIADFLTLSADDLFGDGERAEVAGDPPRHPGLAADGDRVRVVGNLPYNISSPILFRLLALSRETGRLIDATLMLQREVADRIAAVPGSGDYGPLSVLTAVHADVERRFALPPGAFRPPPKVHSAVIRLRFRPAAVDVGDYAHFERIVRTVFQQRRKTVENALRPALRPGVDAGAALAAVQIDPRRRPETLSLPELAALARATNPAA